MSSVHQFHLLVAVAALLPSFQGMRRKTYESVDMNKKWTTEMLAKAQAGGSCPGLLWSLQMHSLSGEGWTAASVLIANCEGDDLANTTYFLGNTSQEALCLPSKFKVHVRSGSKTSDAQWSLVAVAGTQSLTGGAPFQGGLCAEKVVAAKLAEEATSSVAAASVQQPSAEKVVAAKSAEESVMSDGNVRELLLKSRGDPLAAAAAASAMSGMPGLPAQVVTDATQLAKAERAWFKRFVKKAESWYDWYIQQVEDATIANMAMQHSHLLSVGIRGKSFR